MKEKRFNDYRHFKLIIRLPIGNNTDLIDDRDMQVAKELLVKEWIQLREEVDHFFSLVKVEKKPLRLP